MNKRELVKAVREGRIIEAIEAEVKESGKFIKHGYELTPADDEYKVIRTRSVSWHHHDALIAEGTLPHCARIVGLAIKEMVYNGQII